MSFHSQPAITPSRMRQPKAIHRLFRTPGSPSVVINGENAKDRSPGLVVFAQMEHNPNTPPKTAPAPGPSKMAPRMTGMCMVVALITGRGMNPIPVAPMTSSTPQNMARVAMYRVSSLVFFI